MVKSFKIISWLREKLINLVTHQIILVFTISFWYSGLSYRSSKLWLNQLDIKYDQKLQSSTNFNQITTIIQFQLLFQLIVISFVVFQLHLFFHFKFVSKIVLFFFIYISYKKTVPWRTLNLKNGIDIKKQNALTFIKLSSVNLEINCPPFWKTPIWEKRV